MCHTQQLYPGLLRRSKERQCTIYRVLLYTR